MKVIVNLEKAKQLMDEGIVFSSDSANVECVFCRKVIGKKRKTAKNGFEMVYSIRKCNCRESKKHRQGIKMI